MHAELLQCQNNDEDMLLIQDLDRAFDALIVDYQLINLLLNWRERDPDNQISL